MRTLSLLGLCVAAIGGVALGPGQPRPAAAQAAICSYGSEVLCETHETCTERAWNIGFKALSFGLGPCLSKVTRHLYLRKDAAGSGSGTGSGGEGKPDEDDHGDDGESGSAA